MLVEGFGFFDGGASCEFPCSEPARSCFFCFFSAGTLLFFLADSFECAILHIRPGDKSNIEVEVDHAGMFSENGSRPGRGGEFSS
jgi:hypothetical protein